MSLRPEPIHPVPEETARVARAAFPKGTAYTRMRDELGTIWEDEDFAELFSRRGQPALAPWRLALVTVMQFAENLPDRRAADAVRARIDWKFALGLELTDAGFDFSVLSEFRDRLLAGGAEQLLLERMLERFAERGLVKARGKQRTDSTHVLSAVRALNRIELVGETMRAALNALAVAAPEWLRERAPEEWFARYGRPVYDDLPKGVPARKEYAERVGKDGVLLLSWIRAEGSPDWLGRVPAVGLLGKIWEDQYRTEGGELRWREANELPKAGERLDSPYDPDARYGNKRSKRWSGYKLHLTETCDEGLPRVVTRVETTPAHLPDVSQTGKVHEDLARRGLPPAEHLADAGFVDADLLVRSTLEHGIDLVGPVRPNSGWQAKAEGAYDISRFAVDWEAKEVTCPEGRRSRSWKPVVDPWGNADIVVKFARKDCGGCENRALCTRSKEEPRHLTLLLNKEEHEAIQAARLVQETPEWKARYDDRAGIEGAFSRAASVLGLRRARYRGSEKVGLEHVFTAVALSILRVVEWLAGTPPAKRRVSAFAHLAA
ncbi:MAG: IS1182 family transposase [Actinomycetota bacterium]|nr:IS1182 family transposase [Actinomycetota bacterium]